MSRAGTSSIPRLQEVEFLRIAAEQVNAEATYDQVRRSLIEHMAAERERTVPSGNHAALRLARHHEHRYVNNATDALAVLMRLGLVQPAQLPTTRKAAPIYASRTFRMTPDGRAWLDKLDSDRRGAFDDLLRMVWITHPQLAGVLRLLRKGTFANWREVHTERVGLEGREAYIRFLAARSARAIDVGVTGWQATEDEVAHAIRSYIRNRMDADARRQRPDRYLRNSDFVGACEEAVVSFAFGRAGVKMDYITLEIIRRWSSSAWPTSATTSGPHRRSGCGRRPPWTRTTAAGSPPSPGAPLGSGATASSTSCSPPSRWHAARTRGAIPSLHLPGARRRLLQARPQRHRVRRGRR